MLADCLIELICINFSCSCHDDVFPDIELIVECLDLSRGDRVDVLSNTCNWLTQIVISEGGIMQTFQSASEGIITSSIVI